MAPPPAINKSEASSAKTGRAVLANFVAAVASLSAVQTVGDASGSAQIFRSTVTPTTKVFQRYRPISGDEPRPVVV
jgi:hypothetical protein